MLTVLSGLLTGLAVLTGFTILTWLSVLLTGFTVLTGFAALSWFVLSGRAVVTAFASFAAAFANGVTQADARFTLSAAALLAPAGFVLAVGFFRGAVARARRTGAAAAVGARTGAGARRRRRVVFLLVFFAFFFAFLFAFRIFARTVFLESADFQLQFVSFDAETDGQFGGASFDLGRRIQDLIRITGAQIAVDGVAIALAFQTRAFAAFEFSFEIVTIGVSFDTDDKAIALTIDRFIVGFAAFLERKFLTAFALSLTGRRR